MHACSHGGQATINYEVVLSALAGRNPEQGKNALLAAATAVVNLSFNFGEKVLVNGVKL